MRNFKNFLSEVPMKVCKGTDFRDTEAMKLKLHGIIIFTEVP